MKKVMLSVAASMVFLAAACFAQSSAQDSSQGTPNTSQQDPSMGQSSTGQSSGTTMQQGSTSQGSEMKGDKKMKGCIRSEGGQYVLEDKHGKSTPLSGQDLSSHVGHEVTVHGMWASGDTSSTMSSSGAASSGKAFSVSSVDMVSESCPMDKSKAKSPDTMQK